MRLDTEKLPRHLEGGLRPLYLLYGDAPLLVLEAADAIRAAARKEGFAERDVLTVEQGFDWGALTAASQSLSLFCSKKIVDLRIPGGKPGIEGAKTLESYVQKPSPDVLTLITLPKMDKQSLSSKWFEALESQAVVVSAHSIERPKLPQWIASRLAQQNQQADEQTLEFLADCVEGNLLAAHQEIQKLGLLLAPGKISFEEAKKAVLDVARFDVFQLGEAMLWGDTARFTRILYGLKAEGMAEPLVLWQISEDTRALMKLIRGEGKPQAQLMREARIWGPRQALMLHAKKRMKLPQLKEIIFRAEETDNIIKGLKKGDAWEEMLQIGLTFAVRPQTR